MGPGSGIGFDAISISTAEKGGSRHPKDQTPKRREPVEGVERPYLATLHGKPVGVAPGAKVDKLPPVSIIQATIYSLMYISSLAFNPFPAITSAIGQLYTRSVAEISSGTFLVLKAALGLVGVRILPHHTAGSAAPSDGADAELESDSEPDIDTDSESDALPGNNVVARKDMDNLLRLVAILKRASPRTRASSTLGCFQLAAADKHRLWQSIEIYGTAMLRQPGYCFKFVPVRIMATVMQIERNFSLRLDVYGPWGLPLEFVLTYFAAQKFLQTLLAASRTPDSAPEFCAAYLSRPDPRYVTSTDPPKADTGFAEWIAGTLSMKALLAENHPLSFVMNLNTHIPGTVFPGSEPVPVVSPTGAGAGAGKGSVDDGHAKKHALVVMGLLETLSPTAQYNVEALVSMFSNEWMRREGGATPKTTWAVAPSEVPKLTALHKVVETATDLETRGLMVMGTKHGRDLLALCVSPPCAFVAGAFPSLALSPWEIPRPDGLTAGGASAAGTMHLVPMLTPVVIGSSSHPEHRSRGFATHAVLTLHGLPFSAPPRFMLKAVDVRTFVRMLAHPSSAHTDTIMKITLFTPWADDATSAAPIGYLHIDMRAASDITDITLAFWWAKTPGAETEPCCVTARANPNASGSAKEHLGCFYRAMGGSAVIPPLRTGEEFMTDLEFELLATLPATPVFSPGARRGKALGPGYKPKPAGTPPVFTPRAAKSEAEAAPLAPDRRSGVVASEDRTEVEEIEQLLATQLEFQSVDTEPEAENHAVVVFEEPETGAVVYSPVKPRRRQPKKTVEPSGELRRSSRRPKG